MLKTGGSAQNQHPCGDSAFNLEAVGYFARPEDVRARSSLEPFAIADERHFSVEDVKRFVFKMVVWYGEAHPGGIIKCSINPNAPLVVSPVDLMTVGIPRNRSWRSQPFCSVNCWTLRYETGQRAKCNGDPTLRWFWENAYLPSRTWGPAMTSTVTSIVVRHVLPRFGPTRIIDLDKLELQKHLNALAESFSRSLVKKVLVQSSALARNDPVALV
jgi:hypothetical protein